ncbi:DUF4097 family beta strand repeat-containing protein [Rhodanobacter sp. DHG33]|uniref:DUF4097 family beta strand repeat-containing protein n=1 Tax=Rhodanobacter sp. DHG33 TaxID=2775921 RepID=UPI0017867EF1|nr:DUF4097 family beta strand repeat-containing protein [Rhodanobacter sp. DHG33]MBD8898045.1 DUF4097 family beta strand repeat protein [Rhodanobacter sp. DHG33]
MRRTVLALLLLAPLAACAADECRYQAPRNLSLDLAGVRGVQFEVNSYDLHVNGVPGTKQGVVNGRACASDQSALDKLQITQRREGDQLIVELGGQNGFSFHLFGSFSANLEANVQLPPELPVTVRVGSGDASVRGVQQLHSSVGSGDLHVSSISGAFDTSVGSGDVDADDVGSLQAGSVGSGDLKVSGIRGDAKVGSIGSGDVTLRNVGGSVHADTLGSGDLGVHDVGGDLSLGAKGSGDVNQSGVKGKVNVPHDDD